MDEPIYYHVFNRGVDRRPVFNGARDYEHFYSLLDRYLEPTVKKNKNNFTYPNYASSVSLLAFCLMSNHFHLLLREDELNAMPRFMQSLKTAYCRYFNLKHERTGVLFETSYHHRPIQNDGDWLHISRYIHLNPLAITKDYDSYPHSSMRFYLYNPAPPWFDTQTINSSFANPLAYKEFHEDYVRQLANNSLQSINVWHL